MPILTTADGLDLAYYEWGLDRRGDGPPVVLQHGFIANSSLNWELPGIVGSLVAGGRHVVALDARGHGASSAPHESSYYGEAKMAADLSLLYDKLDAPAIHQVGYSMGAIVSLIAATTDPRIERLVVGGVGAGAVEVGGVDTRVLSNELIAEALTTEDAQFAGEEARGFRSLADATGADRLALAAHARVVHATPIRLADITAQTMVIAGTDDPLATRLEVLAEAIPGARLQTVAGDHLQAVVEPAFAAALVEFLGRR